MILIDLIISIGVVDTYGMEPYRLNPTINNLVNLLYRECITLQLDNSI